MNESPLPQFPGPILPIWDHSVVGRPPITAALQTSNPPIFEILYMTSDTTGFPLAVARDLPPEISDLSRIIHTEPNWEVFSGWSDLDTDIVFQVAIRRPVCARFALRFRGGSVGLSMASILRAGGFTFASALPDVDGHLRLKSIITFVVDPNWLLDTLAELRPSVV